MTVIEGPCPDCGRQYMRNYADSTGCDAIRNASTCARATIARLRAELEALKAPAVWVPTSQRMPESGNPVWFVEDGQLQQGSFGGGPFWWALDGESYPVHEVTHWMPRYVEPLPTPPKDTDDAEG